MVHYYETAVERRVRHKSNCTTPCALCGNGQPQTGYKLRESVDRLLVRSVNRRFKSITQKRRRLI